MKPATAWRKVARMGRVAIKDGTFIGGHNMSGATGTLWRVTTGGQGWVMMDEPLPEDLQSFPGNDHRHTLLLLEIYECEPYARKSAVAP